jgi:hypothetical protein
MRLVNFLIILSFLFSCEKESYIYTYEDHCYEIKSKKDVTGSIGRGIIVERYYFLLDNSELREVNLHEYMSFKESDTICFPVIVKEKEIER